MGLLGEGACSDWFLVLLGVSTASLGVWKVSGGGGSGWLFGTLLGPGTTGSMLWVFTMTCVVVGVWGVGLLLPAVLKLMTVVVGGGVVRVVVCQLHSGREHLIWTAAAVHVISFGGLCGVVVVCRECSHLLICTL